MAGSLPERVRPAICAFGGLADGFLPFDVGGGRTEQLRLASVVMKAVQACPRRPGRLPARLVSIRTVWARRTVREKMCLSPPGLHEGCIATAAIRRDSTCIFS